MQRISALPRVGAHALILAFAAFMLLAIGCTGAQASPNGQVASISASAFDDVEGLDGFDGFEDTAPANTVLNNTVLNNTVLNTAAGKTAGTVRGALANTSADFSGPVLTTCNPGRDKVRVECNAVAPTQAQLQHSPEAGGTALFTPVRAETATDQLSGRTPAALTHLDLGIVRT